ncbi:MAG: methyl-accepting chemotaxis protein, partial [Anaerovoracaceae bacterium]
MKSIRTRIMVLIGGIAIIAILISGILVTNKVGNAVLRDESDIANLTTANIAAKVDEYFTDYISTADAMASDYSIRGFLSTVQSRDELTANGYFNGAYSTLADVMAKDGDILSAFVVPLGCDAAFDGGDWISDAGYNLLEKDFWFADAADLEKGYIVTEPYQDVDTGSMVVTVSAPVYGFDGSTVVGVAAIDITIDKLSASVVNADNLYEEGSHIMLVSKASGTILATEKEGNLLKTVSDVGYSEELINEINNSEGNAVKFDDEGVVSYGTVADAASVPWSVLLCIEKGEFLEVTKGMERTLIFTYAIVLIVLFIAIFLVSKSIVAPIKKLVGVTEELADGNLEADIDINSQDETGHLADAMRRLVARLSEYIDYIDEISAALDEFATGHLEIELKYAYDGEFAKIKQSILQMSQVFKGTIGQIVETSERVASGSVEIANASQMLAQGATNQASTTQELTATINELSERVTKNADHAMNASEQVKIVGGAADESNEQMREMINAIAEINDKSSEIGKIIKV